MTYGVVLGIFLIHLGFMLSVLCYWLAARALCPAMVDWSEACLSERPVRTVLVGAAVGVPTFIVGVALAKAPAIPGAAQLGALVLFVLGLIALLGSAGLAQRVGRGLAAPVDIDQPWRPVLRGGIVLVCTLAMPFLGWFLVIPLALLSGLGAAVSYFRHGRRPVAP